MGLDLFLLLGLELEARRGATVSRKVVFFFITFFTTVRTCKYCIIVQCISNIVRYKVLFGTFC